MHIPLLPQVKPSRARDCGVCVEHCYIQAIEIVGGGAVNSEYCRACGRCAAVCHNNAVEIRISDPHFLEKTRERIRSHVKYD